MAPGDPPPKGAREARRRRRLGVLLEARGHYAEAGTQFRAAFDHAPREPSIRCQLSHNLRLRGESFPAMDLVAHSVDIDYVLGRQRCKRLVEPKSFSKKLTPTPTAP